MSKAYRDGWERTFAPKPPPEMLRCPFPLRRGMHIELTLPSDLKLRDIRRLVWYLVTMCDDWEPEQGFPLLVWPAAHEAKTVEAAPSRSQGSQLVARVYCHACRGVMSFLQGTAKLRCFTCEPTPG